MKDYLIRYLELFELTNNKFTIHNDHIWTVYNKMVQPFGPACVNYSIEGYEAQKLFREFDGSLTRWTNGFIDSDKSNWYSVICDDFVSVDDLKSKQRNEINRGLKNCEVNRVDAKYIAEKGYNIFVSAFENYKNVKTQIVTEKGFKKFHIANNSFNDIIHYWGVFNNKQLIGFAINKIHNRLECNYSQVKLHTEFLSLYPAYALFYIMNEYYLGKTRLVDYVNDGFRNILHDTNIQPFLIKKFNFRKSFTKLNIEYSTILNKFIKLTYPFRRIIGISNRKIRALYILENSRRLSVDLENKSRD